MKIITAELLGHSLVEFKNNIDKLNLVEKSELEVYWEYDKPIAHKIYKLVSKSDPEICEAVVIPALGLIQIYLESDEITDRNIGEFIVFSPIHQNHIIVFKAIILEILKETDDSKLKMYVKSVRNFKAEEIE